MALIVETGSGAATSESYISVANADAYLAARGSTLWATIQTAEKEQALRRATDYMRQAYNGRWKGLQPFIAQALDWPRYGVIVNGWYVPDRAVPVDVANACAEFAFRAAFGDLSPDVGAQVTSETVGPISVSYAVGARQTMAFKAIDNLLAKYLTGGLGSIPVVRA